MGSISAGTVIARLGADTSDFSAKFSQAQGTVQGFGDSAENMSFRSSRSFMQMGTGVNESMNALTNGSGNAGQALDMLAFHAGHTAELVSGSAGTMATALGAIGKSLGVLSLIYAAFEIGWKVGKWISDVTGLTDAMGKAGKPAEEMGKILAVSGDQIEQARLSAVKMATSLGEDVPAFAENTAAVKENATAFVEWTDKLLKAQAAKVADGGASAVLGKELSNLKNTLAELTKEGTAAAIQQQMDIDKTKEQIAQRTEHNTGMVKAAELVAKFAGAQQIYLTQADREAASTALLVDYWTKYGKSVEDAYGIITKDSAAATLATMEDKIRAVAVAGADAGQVISKMGPDILKAVEQADKMGATVPQTMKNMAQAIASSDQQWTGQLLTELKGLPDEADKSSAASAAKLAKMGEDLKGSIKGGISGGADAGVGYMQGLIRDAVAKIEGTPIKLQFDIPDLAAAVAAAIDGRSRQTTGTGV